MKKLDLVLILSAMSAIVTIIFIWSFYDIIGQIIFFVGYRIIGFLSIIAILSTCFGSWYIIEKMRILKANRKEAEATANKANMTIVQDKKQTWVIDHKNNHIHNLSLDPRFYPNGHFTNAKPVEISNWETLNTPSNKMIIDQSVPLLDEPNRLDLLTIFTQLRQSYAIIAGQQVGKTFQARHIAYYWLSRGIQPIVVGPKWDIGEWDGCKKMGGSGDYIKASEGIDFIVNEVNQRHSDNINHKSHNILPVFFDDWTPIVGAVDNARSLILEATTLYASVNILLYFILHADTAPAWGVEKIGAALKNNFIKLFILPGYNENGIPIRRKNRGIVRFVGGEEKPIKLFDTPIPLFKSSFPQTIETKSTEKETGIIEKEIQDEDLRIVKMHKKGYSYREMSFQVWGQWGQFYNQKIDRILERCSEK